jgi:type I restriction enzyme S subunit
MQDGYNPIYTTHLLCTPYMKKQIKGCAKQAVNQASINQQDVQSFTILKPPIDLQNQFADFVALTDKSKYAIDQFIKSLHAAKDATA